MPLNYSNMDVALERRDLDAIWQVDPFHTLAVETIKLDPAVANKINIAVFKPGLDVESLTTMGAHAKEFGIIKEEPNYDEHVIQPEG